MRSLVYWHPRLYEGAMRLLYGRHYRARYAEIARRVELGASVVDLCCGDCRLYTQELNGLAGSYQGLDFNAQFAANAIGVLRVKQLCERYGVDKVEAAMREMQDYSERSVRAGLIAAPFPSIASATRKNGGTSRAGISPIP